MTMIGAGAVIDEYNRWVPSYLVKRGFRRSTSNEAHLAQARALLEWCTKHRIEDPRMYIRVRVQLAKDYTPKFRSLASEAVIEAYRERFAPVVLASKLRSEAGSVEAQYIRSLRLNPLAHELVRRDYAAAGKTHLCVAQPELSGSFHPKSPSCGSCAHRAPCASRLLAREGFDVIALRAGRYDLLPAEIARLFAPTEETAQTNGAEMPQLRHG